MRIERDIPDRGVRFGNGLWLEEPDRAEWCSYGFACIAVRHPEMGHWCGYIAVRSDHPWHAQHYDGVPASVHGGLTFSSARSGRIYHSEEPDDAWYLGFDCGHCTDIMPGLIMTMRKLNGGPSVLETMGSTYRDWAYVSAEVKHLAEQASDALEISELTP